jgi:signal transduction histidine kinase/response regulator of citrate/malate metabolism
MGALIFIYFSKERFKNEETLIYKFMLFCNVIGLILQLLSAEVSYKYELFNPIIPDFVVKLYLVYFIVFGVLVLWYVINLCTNKDFKIMRFVFWVYFALCLVVFFLPMNFHLDYTNQIVYTYGTAVDYSSFVGLGTSALIVLILIPNIRKFANKKVIPMFIYLVFCFIAIIIQRHNPELMIICFVESFLCFIMFFTIENPDVKMLREVENAKDIAEKANRAKSDFLSSMSHEIRTPLNAIVGLSEDIASYEKEVPPQVKEDTDDIINASNTLLEIVGNILDISKIESDKLDIVSKPYNFKEEIEKLAKVDATRIGNKPIDFKMNFAKDLPYELIGDKVHVKQIVNNLLTNAIKYTDKGQVILDVKCINNDDKCLLIVSVEDTGRGIKKESIQKLFTKFERLDEKNSTIEGTGLGLAITKRLIEMMGGKIVVQSIYGEGSRFTVYLKQEIRTTPNEVKEEEIDTVVSYNGVKVLAVDDNPLNLKVATKLLKEFNLDIDCVDSGYKCLDKFKEANDYKIIFLDIMMPKMGGVETLRKLKEMGVNIPIIALTADAIQGRESTYLEAGFSAYLAKPIDKIALKKLLVKFLGKGNKLEAKEEIEEEKVAEQQEENKEVQPMGESFLRENGVNLDNSLELLGDMEMYNETLDAFIEENKDRIGRLLNAKNSKDMPTYAIDVHALKSDCKYLGFMHLAELAYDHELKSKEGNIDYVNSHYDELMEEYNRVNEIIRKYKGE